MERHFRPKLLMLPWPPSTALSIHIPALGYWNQGPPPRLRSSPIRYGLPSKTYKALNRAEGLLSLSSSTTKVANVSRFGYSLAQWGPLYMKHLDAFVVENSRLVSTLSSRVFSISGVFLVYSSQGRLFLRSSFLSLNRGGSLCTSDVEI